jgi:cell division septum initiation protein DivIVA
MADHGEPGRDPEFGVRLLGYSRREVDELVAEVCRELRGLHVGPEQAPGEPGGWTALGPAQGHVSRVLRFAQEEADARIAEAKRQAEQTLRSAREVADRLMADARKRSIELEARVASALDREVTARVGELVSTHARLVVGLVGMRDSLVEALELDARLGPVQPISFEDLTQDRAQAYVPRPGGRSAEQAGWGPE